MAAHRYWRLWITARQDTNDTVVSIVELQLRATPGGADLTGSGTASADSQWHWTNAADRAVDNDTGTWWASERASLPHWWKYDFGAGVSYEVQEIYLRARNDGYWGETPRDFLIQYSDNDSDWTTAWSVAIAGYSQNATGVFTDPSVASSTAWTFWRLRGTPQSGDAVSAVGIELRATAGGADQCSGGGASCDVNNTHAPNDAFDNNGSTFWASSNVAGEHWLCYRLPTASTVAEIAYTTQAGGSAVSGFGSFVFERSHDGINWTTQATVSGLTWSSSETKLIDVSESSGPGEPAISAEANGGDEIIVTFDTPGSGATSHKLYWGEDSDCAYLWDDDLAAEPSPVAITSLEPGTTYFFKPVAVNGDGETEGDVVSATTDSPPGTPALSGEADSDTQITVDFSTPGSDATSHEIWWGTDPDSLDLYSPALDATPSPVAFSGLEPATTYYFKPVAINAAGETEGIPISVATLGPSLAVAYVTQTTAGLVLQYDEYAVEVQYQTTTNADTGFASPVDDQVETDADDNNQFIHEVTGLSAGTAYRSRARSRTTHDGTWGAWVTVVTFTTLAATPDVRMGGFTAPAPFAVLSGTQTLNWDLRTPASYGDPNIWTPTEMAVSEDGENWTVLATTETLTPGPTGSFAVNFTDYDSRWVTFRLRGLRNDGRAGTDYRTFYNNEQTEPVTAAPPIDDECWTNKWSDGEGTWYLLGDDEDDLSRAVYVRKGDVRVWLPCAQPEEPSGGLREVIGVRVSCKGIAVAEGGTSYWWMNEQIEGAFIGIDIYNSDLKVAVSQRFTWSHVWPVYPCSNPQNLVGDSIVSFECSLREDVPGVVTSASAAGPVVEGKYKNDTCGVKGEWVGLALDFNQDADGFWTYKGTSIGNRGHRGNLYSDPGAPPRANLPEGLGCRPFVAFRAGGLWYSDALHSGAAVLPIFVEFIYGDPCDSSDLPSEPPAPDEPVINSAVQVDCADALLTVWEEQGAILDSVRFRIAAADDPSFASPILDTSWDTPVYTEPEVGQVAAAYHLQEGMSPGSYLAIIEAQLGSTSYESDPIPFTILGLAVGWWGGWDNRQVEA